MRLNSVFFKTLFNGKNCAVWRVREGLKSISITKMICKIGLRNTLFIFGRKNGRLLFCFVCCNTLSDFGFNFLKPFLKGKILRSSERGVNSILTTILPF